MPERAYDPISLEEVEEAGDALHADKDHFTAVSTATCVQLLLLLEIRDLLKTLVEYSKHL